MRSKDRNSARAERLEASVVSGVPEQGEHAQDILKELGYSDAEIAGLRDREVI